MNGTPALPAAPAGDRWIVAAVFTAAAAFALLGARPYAGGWNDGSRLATVESLVDRATWAIDDSVFVRVPPPPQPGPYGGPLEQLLQAGTQDKLFIRGHYYSDKSPLPALPMAAVYTVAQWLTGLRAAADPAAFCTLLNFAAAGLAYALAVACVFRIGRRLALARPAALALAASFALATVAPAYSRQVNNHVLLLAIATLIELALLGAAARSLPWLGALSGIAYGTDLAAGPALCLCTAVISIQRAGWRNALRRFAPAALAGIALHHALNFAIAGTLRPANMIAAYLQWPGSPFATAPPTGAWHHDGALDFALYALDMQVGKRGFLGHNLPLLLVVAAIPALARRRAERPLLAHAAAWCTLTWLSYAALSDNMSGACASVRWFVPFLAPGYLALAVLLRDPCHWPAFRLLSAWGVVLAAAMWWYGPWMHRLVPYYWPVVAAALASWATLQRGAGATRGAA